MKNFVIALLGIMLLNACSNQKQSKTEEQPTILQIGDHKVSTDEFKYIYNKNNSRSEKAYTKESLDEYMDLFIKFKLKVLEAERLKLDTIPSFIKELEGYQKQLAKPYLTESTVTDKLVKEAYERSRYEVSAAHILVKVAEDANPADTIKAFHKIDSIRTAIINGADFGEMAIKHSDDPSAQGMDGRPGNRGELGYFTAFSMVYPFESGAFNTPVGSVSTPVRTRFGYHIIKVNDKRISQGEVKVAHIMIKAPNGLNPEDSIQAKKKIDEIAQRLKEGGDWNTLCAQYSDHGPSKDKGGEIQTFKLGGRLGAPEFEQAAFALKSPGDISSPVKSSYGWHLIKLIEKLPIKPFDEVKDDIERKIKRDSRSKLNYTALIARLKKENDFKRNEKNIEDLLNSADSTVSLGKWQAATNDDETKKELFSINGISYSVADFNTYVQRVQRPKKSSDDKYLLNSHLTNYINESLYNYEEAHLADKFIDYKMLIKEYRDGILLFQLMDEKVWSKAVKDTVGLKAFYEANKDAYQWKKRAEARVFVLEDISKLDQLKKDLKDSLTLDDLNKKYNNESALMLTSEEGTFEEGKNQTLDSFEWTTGIQDRIESNKAYIVQIYQIKEAAPKQLKEARGLIISDYQNHLETEWIEELRQEKTIKINQEELNKLVKN